MTTILSLVNQKGGVAKTTTSINLAAALAELKQKILLVDMDPQANLTQGLGFTQKVEVTTYEILTEELPITKGIYASKIANVDLVPADIRLANAELELSGVIARETLLKGSFTAAGELDYDYVIIDCSPSLGLLTVNALTSSTDMIIPMEPAIFSLEGIEQLVNITNLIRKKMNPQLEIKGVLLTRVDSRTNIAEDFEAELRNIFGDKIFNTVIHQNVKIAEAQTEGLAVNHYAPRAKGSKEYAALAKELINRD